MNSARNGSRCSCRSLESHRRSERCGTPKPTRHSVRWGPTIAILSHDNYTFYNPRLHPEFTPSKSPILLFEGTYTAEFANKPAKTPRYDYNQILYRLDLDDEALLEARVK